MQKIYRSKYGKIVKQCPGLNEFWYKGKLIACGSCISSANPNVKPSKDDWEFCEYLRTKIE